MSAEYAALLRRIEELENDNRFRAHIAALRKEMEDGMNKNFFLEVRKGNVPGHSANTKFGMNGAIPASTTEEVWSVSTNRTRLTTAATLEAISTDIDDSGPGGSNAASTGVQIITIQGIDDSWNAVEEDITMDGTTASSATSNSYLRVNRVFAKQCGTYGGRAEGTITIRVSGAGSTQAEIRVAHAQTEMCMYTVPTGYKAYINNITVNAGAAKPVGFELFQYTGVDDVTDPYVGAKREIWSAPSVLASTYVAREVEDRYEVVGPADIVMECTNTAGAAAIVEATFDFILVQDGY